MDIVEKLERIIDQQDQELAFVKDVLQELANEVYYESTVNGSFVGESIPDRIMARKINKALGLRLQVYPTNEDLEQMLGNAWEAGKTSITKQAIEAEKHTNSIMNRFPKLSRRLVIEAVSMLVYNATNKDCRWTKDELIRGAMDSILG